MSDRKQALQDLRDKVAAGTCDHGSFIVMDKPVDGIRAHHAYDGSLDAAKALHDAVLPGWDIQMGTCEDDSFEASVAYPLRVKTYDGIASSLARAWLLAILDALIAKETP
ncbi:hypothetical protein phiGT1_66 [Sulfitobacter phage phiGT1]|nr:hypothetical protein phiGT1_66 [Sulfitobacter phage phiGT1]